MSDSKPKKGVFARLFGWEEEAAPAPEAEREVTPAAETRVEAKTEAPLSPAEDLAEELLPDEEPASLEALREVEAPPSEPATDQPRPGEPEPAEPEIPPEPAQPEPPQEPEIPEPGEPIEEPEILPDEEPPAAAHLAAETAETANLADDLPKDLADSAEDLAEDLAGAPPPAPTAAPGWFARLREGLSRTSEKLGSGISDLFSKAKFDSTTLEDLEDLLIQADLGVDASMRITGEVGRQRHERNLDAKGVRGVVASEVERLLDPVAKPLVLEDKKPFVIMMVGVNGSGKTTTIGKLARKFQDEGRTVWLAAGDTFRAAAVEQLAVWGERIGVPVVRRETGADAAGLAFDALQQAREAGADVLLVDTAGRLQNKAELMAELEKIRRVVSKLDDSAPHAVLLVLDATTGQNAISQVEAFGRTAGVTGLVMTKLDGTARGGILVAVAEKFGLPVHFIGVGEGVEDLEPFDARDFSRALVGLDRGTD